MQNRKFILLAVLLVITSSIVVYSADAAGIPKKAISTVARFLESDLPTTTVFTDIANTFGAGQKQTFTSSSTTAGLNIASSGSDPSSLADGDVWLNGATLKYRGSGATKSLVTSAITSINNDATAAQTIQGTAGNTTVSTSLGTTTINTGSNVVVTGDSAQTITKTLTLNSLKAGGQINLNGQTVLNTGVITFPITTGTLALLSDIPPVVLGADLTTTSSVSYTVIFTIPLTASKINVVTAILAQDSDTAGVAIQTRGRTDNAGSTGLCSFQTVTTATASPIANIAVGTAPADNAVTALLAINQVQPLIVQCTVKTGATPGNLILEFESETGSTATVATRAGSYYIATHG